MELEENRSTLLQISSIRFTVPLEAIRFCFCCFFCVCVFLFDSIFVCFVLLFFYLISRSADLSSTEQMQIGASKKKKEKKRKKRKPKKNTRLVLFRFARLCFVFFCFLFFAPSWKVFRLFFRESFTQRGAVRSIRLCRFSFVFVFARARVCVCVLLLTWTFFCFVGVFFFLWFLFSFLVDSSLTGRGRAPPRSFRFSSIHFQLSPLRARSTRWSPVKLGKTR